MSAKHTPKNGDIDAILDELAPIFDRMEKQLHAAGWHREHGRWYSPQGATLAAEARRLQGDRNGKH